MQTALYVKIKERKGELLIGAYTQNLLYLSIVATQHKTRQRRVRRVLIMGKARNLADSLQAEQINRRLLFDLNFFLNNFNL